MSWILKCLIFFCEEVRCQVVAYFSWKKDTWFFAIIPFYCVWDWHLAGRVWLNQFNSFRYNSSILSVYIFLGVFCSYSKTKYLTTFFKSFELYTSGNNWLPGILVSFHGKIDCPGIDWAREFDWRRNFSIWRRLFSCEGSAAKVFIDKCVSYSQKHSHISVHFTLWKRRGLAQCIGLYNVTLSWISTRPDCFLNYSKPSSALSVHCWIICSFGFWHRIFAIFFLFSVDKSNTSRNRRSSWSKFRQAFVEPLQKRVHIRFCHPYRRSCSKIRTAVVLGMRTPASEHMTVDLFGAPRRNHSEWEKNRIIYY